MKIFGINFETKKELRERNALLFDRAEQLSERVADLSHALDAANDELHYMQQMFPLELEETVFDVALKNAQGKYTKKNPSLEHSTITEVVVKKNPSLEHSTITEVVVTEKNYFGLVKRLKNKDVFYTKKAAEEYLKSVCK